MIDSTKKEKKIKKSVMGLFFFQGLLNESGAYLILSAAQSLAYDFNAPNLEPVFPMYNIYIYI